MFILADDMKRFGFLLICTCLQFLEKTNAAEKRSSAMILNSLSSFVATHVTGPSFFDDILFEEFVNILARLSVATDDEIRLMVLKVSWEFLNYEQPFWLANSEKNLDELIRLIVNIMSIYLPELANEISKCKIFTLYCNAFIRI